MHESMNQNDNLKGTLSVISCGHLCESDNDRCTTVPLKVLGGQV